MNNSVNRHNEGRTAINLLFDMQHSQLSPAPHSQMYSNIPKSCTKDGTVKYTSVTTVT